MERRILITAAGAFFAVLVAGALFQPGMIGLGRAESPDGAAGGSSPSAISTDTGASAPSGSYDDDEGYEDDDDDRYEHEDDDDDRYEHDDHDEHDDHEDDD